MEYPIDPFLQFEHWYQAACNIPEADPQAMCLATANKAGRPSARMVLYKGISEGGFLIYTNYESRKAQEIAENPFAALTFYWPRSYRQIRIEGQIQKISSQESHRYFKTRSKESQMAACISQQSREIPDRETLIETFKNFKVTSTEEIDCPSYWGGFRLIPDRFEFWEGKEHRLHERYCYEKTSEGWREFFLAP